MIRTYLSQIRQNAHGIIETLDMIWCTIQYGASPNNYVSFDFKHLNAKERNTYVTNRISRKIIKRFNNPDYINLFEDKTKFAERFSDYLGRSWISTEKLSYNDFLLFLEGKNKFIYNPVGNAQGQGIKVYDNLSEPKKIFDEVMYSGQKAILEEWIQQHERFDTIYDKAINCLRIITIYKNNKTKFLAGGVTWGNGMQIANASASGIVSPVNFKTGILEKPAADFYGNIYERHPITGADLLNLKIPFWNEVVTMLENAASEVPEVGYVGWDVAITPDGPILIEGNTTPGYRYYQIPAHMENKCGNKETYIECLH